MKGTLNVLKACSVMSIKRVVMVSSIGAVTMNPNWPKDRVMDEDCWSDIEYCKISEVIFMNLTVSFAFLWNCVRIRKSLEILGRGQRR